MVSCVITAAGKNTRMRSDLEKLNLELKNKLTLPLKNNKTIIDTTINNVLNAGVDECIVVLGHYSGEIMDCLSNINNSKIKIIENNPCNVGLSTSLYNGLKNTSCDEILCVSADQPTVTSTTYKNLINTFKEYESKKSIVVLRRKGTGILNTAEGLGMPFVTSKNNLIPYIKNENNNLNPILRKIFDDGFSFIGVIEDNPLELININHYEDYLYVLNNL